MEAQGAVTEKIRPFIVLNDRINLVLDGRGVCIKSERIIGVSGTRRSDLVEGRPSVAFTLNGSGKTTHAFLDSLRTVDSLHQKVRHAETISAADQEVLTAGLDSILHPEQRFFLRPFFRGIFLPGEIWNFKIPTQPDIGTAMIILKRGQFFVDGHEAGGRTLDDLSRHKHRHTPYLVAVFPPSENLQSLRGITWSKIRLMALQEKAFVKQAGAMNEDTVAIFLNNLRQRIGLPEVTYKRPSVKSGANMFMGRTFLRLFGL